MSTPPRSIENKYCRIADLSNEASVESFFVLRLLKDFGYKDEEIKTKQSIASLNISRGRAREAYKPDFLLMGDGKPRWLVEAKATGEDIEAFTYQGAGYSLLLNQKDTERPVRYYMMTNGLLTRVYDWDQQEAILSLHFRDFIDGNATFQRFRELFNPEIVRKGWTVSDKKAQGHKMARPPIDDVKKAFARCHRIIWKSEKMSPQASFFEFAKLLFVKIMEDKKIRDNEDLYKLIIEGSPLPPEQVRFSSAWIEGEEKAGFENPVNTILFRNLREKLETQIQSHGKKRVFEKDEDLRLSSGTAKRVVKELENYFLFGIDEDLNGRMFETFLSATMRGQDLGQYFSPRSITKLITRLANIKVSEEGIEKVIDACCGTGGFLIEALTQMREKVEKNASLSAEKKTNLNNQIANECIYGIDASRDPALAKIARINMYLHGDGGSRIYMTDSLRTLPEATDADSLEIKGDVKELREKFSGGNLFDVVLSNPPFSMSYSSEVPDEKEILDQYDLSTWEGKKKKSLRSSVMFMERYWYLLKPGGRILTVIDDSVLSSKSFIFARDWMRKHFVIKGIISLHGDAFQRQGARAKTSILILEKTERATKQPAFFVFESQYIGVDDVVTRTPRSVAEIAKDNAKMEIEEIVSAYSSFNSGDSGAWLLPGETLTDRMDVKYLKPWSTSVLAEKWKDIGAQVEMLGQLVDPIDNQIEIDPEKTYTFLRVTYTGRAERGEQRRGDELSYSKMAVANVGDLVVSNIGAVYGSICVIPEGFQDCLVSSEFTVMRQKPGVKVDAMYLWTILRSPVVLAEWISDSSGVSRHRIEWDKLEKQLVPLLPYEKQKTIGDLYRQTIERELEAKISTDKADALLDGLDLEAEAARDRLTKAKPPQ